MKNKLHDIKELIKYNIIVLYRRIRFKACQDGTYWYKKNGKCYRNSIYNGGSVSFGDYKHIPGSYRVFTIEEEVPFLGY